MHINVYNSQKCLKHAYNLHNRVISILRVINVIYCRSTDDHFSHKIILKLKANATIEYIELHKETKVNY